MAHDPSSPTEPGPRHGKSFLVQTSHYWVANLLLILSSLISFPVLTRLFTLEQYGLLGLVSTTLALLVGIGKLGIQNAVLRFHSEVRSGKSKASLEQYHATSVVGMLATGGLVTLLFVIVVLSARSRWSDPMVPRLLVLAALLVPIQVGESALVNITRARQRSAFLNAYLVLKKYSVLAAILATLYFIHRSVAGFYVATVATEAVAVLLLGWVVLRRAGLSTSHFSVPLFRQMLTYGVPMVGYEVACNVLDAGNRYVVQHLMGAAVLGVYSATYTACQYVGMPALSAMSQAALPIYLGLWEQRGRQETEAFLAETVHYFGAIAAPILAGFCAIGPEFITVVAGAKYVGGAVIIPYVLGGIIMSVFVTHLAAGLYIEKRSAVMMINAAVSGVLNLLLNLLLVPMLGLAGAGLATLLAYLALALLTVRSQRALTVRLPWASYLKFSLLAILMHVVVIRIHLHALPLTIVARVLAGVVLYGLPLVALDPKVRSVVSRTVERVLATRRATPKPSVLSPPVSADGR